MLVKRARCGATRQCSDASEAGILLPFLFHTHTIQRRHFRPRRVYQQELPGDVEGRQSGFITRSYPFEPQGSVGSHADADADTDTHAPRHGHSSRRDYGGDQERMSRESTRPLSHDRTRQRSQQPRQFVDHVPFDRAGATSATGHLDKSTITPGEKRAFEKLFALNKDKQGARPPKPSQDEDGSMHDVLEKALSDIRAQRNRPPKDFPAALQPMADEARSRRERQKAESKEFKRTAGTQRELHATNALLDAAESDIDLLRALETHVLGRVAALKLDGQLHTEYASRILHLYLKHREKRQTRISKKVAPRQYDAEVLNDIPIMTVNFPDHLLHYMSLSTEKFPGSLLPLNLLPALKRLGPSAFALGATTQLYNAHLRLLYAKFPFELHAIIETLHEMDREVYSFDEDTEAVLVGILRDSRKYAVLGQGGPALQLMWQTDRARRSMKKLIEWRHEMARRREEEALKKAAEEEAMREVGLEDDAVAD